VLHTDDGFAVELALVPEMVAELGGSRRLHRRQVLVGVDPALDRATLAATSSPIAVRWIEVVDQRAPSPSRDAVTGPQPWISLLCKFSDVAAEPRNLSYFQNMYASTWPGLDHYWRQLSYDTANVQGSTAVAWVDLPHPVSHYETAGGGDLNAMVNDCTAAADSMVYFPNFVGINMMFNSTFGPYAWGGGRYLNLDGSYRFYRVTWEPPWGYQNVAVIAHEMGHGFGLPHSNNADGDDNPYDNPWDVMSNSWGWAVGDGTYGTVGKGTISYHLDMLGWISAQHRLVISENGLYDVTIDHLALDTTPNLRMVKIQIPSSNRFYTVEVRDRVGYDGNLPGFAVIIHQVDTSRREDAWLVDPVNPSDGSDEGAMWKVGECFDDAPNEISVCVISSTADGFNVRIGRGDTGTVFFDGFEADGFGAWSRVVE
jgi:M6 family metalloprotease-like protein